MKKTVWLVILFLILGVGAYMGYQRSQKSATSAALTWDRDFKIDDVSKVAKIFLADKRGRTATLEKTDKGYWTLDGDRRVSRFIPKNMLEIMESMEYQYLLNKNEEKGVVDRMITSAIKCEMYDAKGNNITTFYVGPNSRNHEGTYFMKEGSDHPQIMNMPGFVGDLRPRFEINKAMWWDLTMIELQPEQIESISIFYPKQKSKSFKLERKSGEWDLSPLDPLVTKRKQKVNADVLATYLEEFASKEGTGFRNEEENQEEILKQVPFAEIVITRVDQEEPQKMNFYPISPEGRNDAGLFDSSSSILRMWAKVEYGDFYTTQLRVFSPLFRSYQSFF